MITELRIRNLAIVESADIRFDGGFNVITGETGAGKSLLVDALHLILGGRASTDLIRTGEREASVEAFFEGLDGSGIRGLLDEMGLPDEEGGELLVRRTVNAQGKSRVWLNGALATVGQLEKLSRFLVDISGQHEHVSLLRPELHLGLLDAFAGTGEQLNHFREAFDALLARKKERDALASDDAARADRCGWLKFQLEELDAVDPKPGELEELEQQRRSLESVEKQRRMLSEADALIYSGDGCALGQVTAACAALKAIADVSPEAASWEKSLDEIRLELSELARDVARHSGGLNEDPEALEHVIEREEDIRRLTRKHGGTVEEVLARRARMREELDSLERRDERLEELDADIRKLTAEALTRARALSEARRAAAKTFAEAVENELKKLAMERTVFEAALTPCQAGTGAMPLEGGGFLTRAGLENGEFLIAPNAGETIRPLARIASGGELSRVMLAIKRVLARADPVFTYVFDEVDTGMSGAAADAVGRLLQEVSLGRQIIVITHLPQIAAFGTRHFTVSKESSDDGRVRTRIEPLDEDGRERELARMLAGSHVTEAALVNARAMLRACAAGV